MAVYTVTGANCPAVQVPSSITSITGAVPTSGDYLISGDTAVVLSPKLGRQAVRVELGATYGGGAAYAVHSGLDLSTSSGLTVSVSAGLAVVQGLVQLTAALTQALTDNVYSWVWLTQSGTLAVATQVAGTPAPAVPTGGKVFLGRVRAVSGSLTEYDYSGRCELKGGVLWRKTADPGAPGDSPSASIRLLSQSSNGLYFWDGTAWLSTGGLSGVVPEHIVSGGYWSVPQYHQAEIFGSLLVTGTLYVAGRIRVVA